MSGYNASQEEIKGEEHTDPEKLPVQKTESSIVQKEAKNIIINRPMTSIYTATPQAALQSQSEISIRIDPKPLPIFRLEQFDQCSIVYFPKTSEYTPTLIRA